LTKRELTEAQLEEIARELEQAAAGTRPESCPRGEVVERWAGVYGVSAAQIYRWARAGGWASGRKQRADMGTRRESCPRVADVERAALLKHQSTTGKYNNPMPAEVAADVTGASSNGVKPHHINQLLRARQLDRRALAKPAPRMCRRSTRPNEEHQFDTSVCSIWYLDERGSQARLRVNPQAGKDQNKPARGRQVIRYVLTDHFTHCTFVQYQHRHESFISSAAHLHAAWTRKREPEKFPLCGCPTRLYVDQGATYHSGHIQQLCENLGVELVGKQPTGTRSRAGKLGHPSALGSVECAHWIVESHFETRMRVEKPESLEELNARAYEWCVQWNGQQIHRRYGMTRSQLWSTIRSDELRIPPADLAAFMALAEKPATCHIYGDLTIRFKGRRYLLENIPVDLRETDAEVMYSPWTFPEVRVRGIDGGYYLAKPLAKMDALEGGYYEHAVATGDFRSFKDTTTERSQKHAERNPVVDGLDAFRGFAEGIGNLSFMSRAGEEIQAGPGAPVRMSIYRALARIHEALGRVITVEESEALTHEYGDWMTAEEIDAAIQRLQSTGKQPRINTDFHG